MSCCRSSPNGCCSPRLPQPRCRIASDTRAWCCSRSAVAGAAGEHPVVGRRALMENAKQIVVQSVVGATYFTCPSPWACISIVTEAGTWPKLSDEHRVGLLQLAFADIGNSSGNE